MPAYRGSGKALDNRIQGYYSRVRLPVGETVTPLTENPTNASVSRVGDEALGKPDDRLT